MAAITTPGVFSQTYGSLLTVTLHINIVPCVYLSMPEPDELDITASIMHGTVAGEVQHGGGVSAPRTGLA